MRKDLLVVVNSQRTDKFCIFSVHSFWFRDRQLYSSGSLSATASADFSNKIKLKKTPLCTHCPAQLPRELADIAGRYLNANKEISPSIWARARRATGCLAGKSLMRNVESARAAMEKWCFCTTESNYTVSLSICKSSYPTAGD